MTNVQQLQVLVDQEKGSNLINLSSFLKGSKIKDAETICGFVLKTLDNEKELEYDLEVAVNVV